MKTFAFITAFILSTKLFGQTVEISTVDRYLRIGERYNVLKTDSQIKEGKYTKYVFPMGRTLSEGFYKDNNKDSLWINYGYQNLVADSGHYSRGKKIGIWKAYKFNGPLHIQYDFTNKLLMYYKPDPDDKDKRFTVISGDNKTINALDRPPIYLGGESGFITTIGNSISYPRKARENNIQGKVIVGLRIDEDGNTSGYRIIKPLGYGCDEEALKAVKSLDEEWLPGILNGKPVSVEYEISVNFKLAS